MNVSKPGKEFRGKQLVLTKSLLSQGFGCWKRIKDLPQLLKLQYWFASDCKDNADTARLQGQERDETTAWTSKTDYV